jgi:hypothetical protein
MGNLVAAICDRRKYSSVVSDRESGTNFHRSLRGGGFFRGFGLFEKVNRGFVAIVSDEVWRFFQAETAQCAVRVHIPLPGRILGLLV